MSRRKGHANLLYLDPVGCVSMPQMGLGRVKTKSDLVVMPSGRQIFRFFALRMTVEPKIPVRFTAWSFYTARVINIVSRAGVLQQ